MAIEKQQPVAGMYAQAAAMTGKAIAAQRDIEAAKEQHREIRRMEAEERAHQWEIEKMEIRSRMDFAEEERTRQEKRANLQAAVKKIDELAEAGQITSENAEAYKTKAVMGYYDVSLSDRALGLVPEKEDAKKIPSRTDVDAALKFLTEFEEKERKWHIPYVREVAPTAEERAAVPYYQDILQRAGMGAGEAGRVAVSMTPVEQDVNINVRPNSKEEFRSIVRQLDSFDKDKGQRYYKQYVRTFEW